MPDSYRIGTPAKVRFVESLSPIVDSPPDDNAPREIAENVVDETFNMESRQDNSLKDSDPACEHTFESVNGNCLKKEPWDEILQYSLTMAENSLVENSEEDTDVQLLGNETEGDDVDGGFVKVGMYYSNPVVIS